MAKKSVLIVDDDKAFATALSLRCDALGVSAATSPDALHAYGVITQQPPDLLILDVNMPAASGLSMCEELSRDVRFAPIPVVVLTGATDAETIDRCERLGACYVAKGSDTWERLKPVVCSLLELQTDVRGPAPPPTAARSAASPPASGPRKVLVVDDDADFSKAATIRLRSFGAHVVRAYSGMQGFWVALKEQPDVIILDYRMPNGYGSYLLERLQRHALTQRIPVVMLTGQKAQGKKDFGLERDMLRLGAAAFFTKPPDFQALWRELRSLTARASSEPHGADDVRSAALSRSS